LAPYECDYLQLKIVFFANAFLGSKGKHLKTGKKFLRFVNVSLTLYLLRPLPLSRPGENRLGFGISERGKVMKYVSNAATNAGLIEVQIEYRAVTDLRVASDLAPPIGNQLLKVVRRAMGATVFRIRMEAIANVPFGGKRAEADIFEVNTPAVRRYCMRRVPQRSLR
jgi:hypothetical protein